MSDEQGFYSEICQENSRLKARIDQLEKENRKLVQVSDFNIKQRVQLREQRDALEKQLVESQDKVKAFEEAMGRENGPEWSANLKSLADRIEKVWPMGRSGTTQDLEYAARELRYMADSFTLKGNFIPSNLRIKELEAEAKRLEAFHVEDMRVTNESADFHIKECSKLRDSLERERLQSADLCDQLQAHKSALVSAREAFVPLRNEVSEMSIDLIAGNSHDKTVGRAWKKLLERADESLSQINSLLESKGQTT